MEGTEHFGSIPFTYFDSTLGRRFPCRLVFQGRACLSPMKSSSLGSLVTKEIRQKRNAEAGMLSRE